MKLRVKADYSIMHALNSYFSLVSWSYVSNRTALRLLTSLQKNLDYRILPKNLKLVRKYWVQKPPKSISNKVPIKFNNTTSPEGTTGATKILSLLTPGIVINIFPLLRFKFVQEVFNSRDCHLQGNRSKNLFCTRAFNECLRTNLEETQPFPARSPMWRIFLILPQKLSKTEGLLTRGLFLE